MKLDDEQQYEQAWAAALAASALQRTQYEFDGSAKARLSHALKPFLTGGIGLPGMSIWTPLNLMIVPASSSRMPVGHDQRFWAPAHPLMILQAGCFKKIEDCLLSTEY
jgi:hypothetical protein